MAYVPGFRHDIYVSYAHADNLADADGVRWVDHLCRDLQDALRKRFPRECDIFFDPQGLQSNEIFDHNLSEIRRSATFLAIISPSYVARDWTFRELTAFRYREAKANETTPAERSNQIVIAELLPVEQGRLPATLGNARRFRFYESDADAFRASTLRPSFDSGAYFKRLDELAEHLVQLLRALREAERSGQSAAEPESSPPAAPPSPVSRPIEPGSELYFILADRSDQHLGRIVLEALQARNLPVSMPLYEGSASEIRDDLERNLIACTGFVIIYGNASEVWVRAQLHLYAELAGRRQHEPRVKAILVGPPPKAEIGTAFSEAGFDILDLRRGVTIDTAQQVISTLSQLPSWVRGEAREERAAPARGPGAASPELASPRAGQVFLSYSSADEAAATLVARLLRAANIRCYFRPAEIRAGSSWSEDLKDGLMAASAVVLILSRNADRSAYVGRELENAAAAQKPILTFRIEDMQPGPMLASLLGDRQWVDGFPGPIEQKVGALVELLRRLFVGAEQSASLVAPVGTSAPGGAARPVDDALIRLAEVQRAAAEWDRSGRRLELLLHRGARLQALEPYRAGWPGDQAAVRAYLDACRAQDDAERAEQDAASMRDVSRRKPFLDRLRDLTVSASEMLRLWRRPRSVGTTTAVLAAMLLAFAPLILAFAAQIEIGRGSIALVDPGVKAGPGAHASEVTAITFNGSSVITSSYDGTIKSWDLNSGQLAPSVAIVPAPAAIDQQPNQQQTQQAKSPVAPAPRPLAVAIGPDGKLIAMTDEGIARDDGKGNLAVQALSTVVARPDGTSVQSSDAATGGSALDVVSANTAPYAIARNWFPHRAGATPFVALALPGSADTYAIGEVGGSIAIETGAANAANLPVSSGGVQGACVANCGPTVTGRVSPAAGSPNHAGAVTALAVSADGKLASISDDGSTILWSVQKGQFVSGRKISDAFQADVERVLSARAGLSSAVFSPDGRQVLTATAANDTAAIWDAATGRQIAALSGGTAAAFSPDGQRIATVSLDKLLIWDAGTHQLLRTVFGLASVDGSVAFSPDGQRVVTENEADNTAEIWDVETGELIRTLAGHTASLHSAAFSPDGQHVVTAAEDNTARIWDAATGQQFGVLTGHVGGVYSAAYSPDGRFIVTGSADKTARIWDATTFAQVAMLSGHSNWVMSAAFSRDGRYVVTSSLDQTARIWDAGTFQQVDLLSGHTGGVESAAFSPDGQRIVTASLDNTARIWGWKTTCTPCTSTAFSGDGTRLITAGASGAFQIWNAGTGELVRGLQQDAAINVVRLSKDGQTAITAGDDGAARLWDVASGAPLAVIRGHGDAVVEAELTPDGTRLVTAARDGSARVTSLAVAQALDKVDVVPALRRYIVPPITAFAAALASIRSELGFGVTRTIPVGGSGGDAFDDASANQDRLPVSGFNIVVNLNPADSTQPVIGTLQTQWGGGLGPLHGGKGPLAQPATPIKFAADETIVKVDINSMTYNYPTTPPPVWIAGLRIFTSKSTYTYGDMSFGPTSECIISTGQSLIGFFGRSGSYIDQLGCIISSIK